MTGKLNKDVPTYKNITKQKLSQYMPGKVLRRLRLPEFLDMLHMKVVGQPDSSPAFTHQEIPLVFISVRG
jgi:hypothetical protein